VVSTSKEAKGILDPGVLKGALRASFKKLDPRALWSNPVMLCVEVGSVITTVNFAYGLASGKGEPAWFTGLVSFWLWLTVLFATFAEALAEGRGKARAEDLRKTRTEVMAKKLKKPELGAPYDLVSGQQLRKGDVILVEANDMIPGDGEVIVGAALVDESAVTGESAPVVREAGGDRSAVTGGTRVIANRFVMRITANPGETFLDRMIALVEGAKRRKTPNEIALEVLLIALTVVFLLVVLNLSPVSIYSAKARGQGQPVTLTVIIALFVCLIPTTIAALLSAIGIAGMDRLFQRNVIAMSGRAIEAAGDVNVLLLDKTGTITLGNRQAVAFIPVAGHTDAQVAEAAFWLPSPTRPRKVAALWCWLRKNINCACGSCRPTPPPFPSGPRPASAGWISMSAPIVKARRRPSSALWKAGAGPFPRNLIPRLPRLPKPGAPPWW